MNEEPNLITDRQLRELIKDINKVTTSRVVEIDHGQPLLVTEYVKENLNRVACLAKTHWQMIAAFFDEFTSRNVKRAVCGVLSGLDRPELTDFFVKQLQASDADIRCCAAIGLAHIGRGDILEHALSVTADVDISPREKYHYGVAFVTLSNALGIDFLIDVLTEEKEFVIVSGDKVKVMRSGTIYCFLIDELLSSVFGFPRPLEPWFWIEWWKDYRGKNPTISVKDVPTHLLQYVPSIPEDSC